MSITAHLTVLKDGNVFKTSPVQGELTLGRAKDSDIRLDDQAVSRQHAVFRWNGKNLEVENKSEFGALLLNGLECPVAKGSKLNDADIIIIGPYIIKISLKSEAGAEPGAVSERQAPRTPTPTEGTPAELSLEVPGIPAVEAVPMEVSTHVALEPLPSEPLPSEPSEPVGSVEFGQDFPPISEPSVMIADDARTKFTPSSALMVRLIFEKDTANVTDYTITKEETSIGRGKDCDIVLQDKKSSRKNSIIRKVGSLFLIKDLDSANGTFVNGEKIIEHELSGNDRIKIGAVEFEFKAESADYAKQQESFLSVDQEPAADEFDLSIPSLGPNSDPELGPEFGTNAQSGGLPEGAQQPYDSTQAPSVGSSPELGLNSQMMGITGITGGGNRKRTLLERFRALPKRTQIIATLAMILFFMFLTDEDTVGLKNKKGVHKKPGAADKNTVASKITTGPASFESLTVEQKRFVESQHSLAFDYYKNKDYDKSLFEIAKVFALIPDYKDAREIERYAKEGKRKLEALEEERKKKEEEAQLKDKIAHLVEDTKLRMEKKDYDQVNELFTQILALDPDNVAVSDWRKEIEAHTEELKLKAQQKELVLAVNNSAWSLYKQGLQLKKSGKYHTAINTFQRALELQPSQKKVPLLLNAEIKRCQALIRKARDPLLAEAKTLEAAGSLTQAFNLYKRATLIDPPHPTGYAGMGRIKGILHERVKVIYTEAIIAESYSDFANAKQMFKECLENAPIDDIYHQRAARKLAHYFEKREQTQP